jgi:hypothetical protein
LSSVFVGSSCFLLFAATFEVPGTNCGIFFSTPSFCAFIVIDTFNDLVELITRDSLTASHVGYDSYDSTVGLNVFGPRHYNARLYPDAGEILVVNLRLTHRNRRNGDKAQDIPRFVNDVSLHTPEVYNCKLMASNLLHLLCSKAKLRPETARTFRCVCWDAASGVQNKNANLKPFVSKAVCDLADGLRYVPSAGGHSDRYDIRYSCLGNGASLGKASAFAQAHRFAAINNVCGAADYKRHLSRG